MAISKGGSYSVSKTLKNDKITTGNQVQRFEKKLNNFLKSQFSVTCNSGTTALFLAMQAINIKKNDTIIYVTSNLQSFYYIIFK